MKLSKKELISEHKHLLNTLLEPTKEKLKREAKKQNLELKSYLLK
jgi:hypothetical protein